MQRQHLGWACNDPRASGSHYEQVFSRQPAPSTWPTVEIPSKRKRTKPKAVTFDEQRDSEVEDDELAEVGDDEQRGSVGDFLRRKRRW